MRKQVSRDTKSQNESIVQLNKAFSPLDYAYYEHFTAVLEKKISTQPADFAQEVNLFEQYLAQTSGFCDTTCKRLSNEIKTNTSRKDMLTIMDDHITFDRTLFHTSFAVYGYECLMMKFSPKVFRRALRVRNFPTDCHKDKPLMGVRKNYCRDHFKYNFPWHVLKQSNNFVSPCL